jgi:hypothetical protein
LAPEYICQSDHFRDQVLKEYQKKVQTKLLKKEWFTKVEAFEDVTDFWNIGKGKGRVPEVGIYVPVAYTIMPRPKFRDYSKDDEGNDYTLKTDERHTVSPATSVPSTLKPAPFSPPLQNID